MPHTFWISSWISPLANHLWQSTVIIAAAWLLAFALRKNQARTRYWIWMAASLKFLIPFSLLIAIGGQMGSIRVAPIVRPTMPHVVEQVTQPFSQTEEALPAGTLTAAHNLGALPAILLSLWVCGVLILSFTWAHGWWKIYRTVRTASRRVFEAGVPVLTSSSLLEPGVFGIVQPVLMLPEGITDRLSHEQLQAIVAHEMCHVRRRDNLTFALHMFVETIFWFHPLVWYIRTRLIEERERACDEAVLQSGSEAEVYAEGILNVCKFCVESPLACVSGVTGSDLKQRIVRIMTLSAAQKLGPGRRLLLAGAVALALVLPVVLGLLHIAGVRAQEDTTAARPEFEVATIKPNKIADDRRGLYLSQSKFTVTGMPIAEVIRFAYDLKSDAQLVGGPSWVNSDRFDIEAKADEAQAQALSKLPPSEKAKQMRLMVQSLLVERFGLKVSHTTKELPIYALVIAKGGPKVTATTAPPMVPPGDQPPPGDAPAKKSFNRGIRMNGNGSLTGMAAPIALLADVLSRQPELDNRLVQDKTGLTGDYDWTLKWTPMSTGPAPGGDAASSNASDSSEPSLFTALQEQLGLKLEPQKGPIDVVVIDSIEKPTAN